MTFVLYELTGKDNRRFSPYCWRTRMALAHKGLIGADSDIEYIACSFTEKDKIAFANYDKYPLLIDTSLIGNEKQISDSWAIACYLEDAYATAPALFGDQNAKGTTEFLNAWADTVLHPAMLKPILGDVFNHIVPKDRDYFRQSRTERFGRPFDDLVLELGEHRETLIDTLRQTLAPVRTLLTTRDWICGPDGPAYGDYIVFGAFQWARSVSPLPLLEKSDPIYAWRTRMMALFDGYANSTNAYSV